jgi:hypothetical protein
MVQVWMKTGWLWWLATNCVHGETWLKSAASVEIWVDVFFLYLPKVHRWLSSTCLAKTLVIQSSIGPMVMKEIAHKMRYPKTQILMMFLYVSIEIYWIGLNCLQRRMVILKIPEISPISPVQWPNCHHPAAEPSGQHPVQQNPQGLETVESPTPHAWHPGWHLASASSNSSFSGETRATSSSSSICTTPGYI